MPEYPQLARDITTLRKSGDVDGAISLFNNADLLEKNKPEVRGSMAWCLYDRDIKSCNASDINVTGAMLETAQKAVHSVRKLIADDLYSKFSAYPWSLLTAARLMRDHEQNERLIDLLSLDDPLLFSSLSDSKYPSQKDQWVNLAIETGKRVLGADNLTQTRAKTVEPILENLKKLDSLVGLSNEKPNVEVDGKKKRIPSAKQRFVLQYSRFLQVMERDKELAEFCDAAIARNVFLRDPNLKWILYRLAKSLTHSNPERALQACNEFIALEYRPYSLLLRAEILLATGDRDAALKETAHSLQIISNRDLPFITKNLTFLADLTEDMTIKRDHLQMVRAIRADQGHPPSPQLEKAAEELGLPPADQSPSADTLRAQWNLINPETVRPAAVHSNSKRKTQTSSVSQAQGDREKIDVSMFDTTSARYGEVIFAPIISAQGDARRRPVIVIGELNDELLVGLLHTQPTSPRAVTITSWKEAGLNQATAFVPSVRIVKTTDVSKIGHLSAIDIAKIRNIRL
jgi:hypothetical protein